VGSKRLLLGVSLTRESERASFQAKEGERARERASFQARESERESERERARAREKLTETRERERN
jgi:hypothetical protein